MMLLDAGQGSRGFEVEVRLGCKNRQPMASAMSPPPPLLENFCAHIHENAKRAQANEVIPCQVQEYCDLLVCVGAVGNNGPRTVRLRQFATSARPTRGAAVHVLLTVKKLQRTVPLDEWHANNMQLSLGTALEHERLLPFREFQKAVPGLCGSPARVVAQLRALGVLSAESEMPPPPIEAITVRWGEKQMFGRDGWKVVFDSSRQMDCGGDWNAVLKWRNRHQFVPKRTSRKASGSQAESVLHKHCVEFEYVFAPAEAELTRQKRMRELCELIFQFTMTAKLFCC